MATNQYAGTVGHLTVEEERTLQRTWIHLMRLCGEENLYKYEDTPPAANGAPHANGASETSGGPLSSCPVAKVVKDATGVNGVSETNGQPEMNGVNGTSEKSEVNGVSDTNGAPKTNGVHLNGDAVNGTTVNGTPETNGAHLNGTSEVNGVHETNGAPKTNGVHLNGDAVNVTAVNGDVPETKAAPKTKTLAEHMVEIKKTVPDKTEVFRKLLTNKSPDAFRQRLWEAVKADNPDALVLRFLRARKWDEEKAVEMLVSAVNWRADMRIQEDVVGAGDSVGLKDAPSKDDKDFLEQYRSGKSFVRGTDNDHHPVYVIRVKLHNPNAQSAKTMENYVLHNIESIRLLVREPNDKACLIFDLSGFGLKNMDFHIVKFIVQVFEARYPETLGLVLVHNAPFVFWGVWNIIKGWLDPVIASKINFTRGNDMKRFIPKDKLHKTYGGDDHFDYKFTEPAKDDNAEMQNVEKRAEIQKERDELAFQYEKATLRWVVSDPKTPEAKNIYAKRTEMARELRENYWHLDPHIRARTHYDRIGALKDTSIVNFDLLEATI